MCFPVAIEPRWAVILVIVHRYLLLIQSTIVNDCSCIANCSYRIQYYSTTPITATVNLCIIYSCALLVSWVLMCDGLEA